MSTPHPRGDDVQRSSAAPSDVSLATRIQERIASRLGRRIRDLEVRVVGNAVKIAGRCSTYYSKQLAQHAALGVIEDETIQNNIEVGPVAERVRPSLG